MERERVRHEALISKETLRMGELEPFATPEMSECERAFIVRLRRHQSPLVADLLQQPDVAQSPTHDEAPNTERAHGFVDAPEPSVGVEGHLSESS